MWLVDNSSECCLSQSGRFIIVGDPIQCRINFKKGFPHNVSHSFVVMEIPKEDYPDWFKEGNFDALLSGVPDYFGRNKISSGGDLSHYSSASLY